MEATAPAPPAIDHAIAHRLKALRQARAWTLDDLARRSGVSRASLSRLENAETSATATILGKLGSAFGLSVSRLLYLAEGGLDPLVRHADQAVWQDPETGFLRRTVSPPTHETAGEVLECTLQPNVTLRYDRPPRPGLEHHLVLLEGALTMTLEEDTHVLAPGDALRYRLFGPSAFQTGPDAGARYILFLVSPS